MSFMPIQDQRMASILSYQIHFFAVHNKYKILICIGVPKPEESAMKENQMHAVLNDMHNLVDGLSYNQLLYVLPQTHVHM